MYVFIDRAGNVNFAKNIDDPQGPIDEFDFIVRVEVKHDKSMQIAKVIKNSKGTSQQQTGFEI